MDKATQRAVILRLLIQVPQTTRSLRAAEIMSISPRIFELEQQGAAIHRGWTYWTDSLGAKRRQRQFTLISAANYDPAIDPTKVN